MKVLSVVHQSVASPRTGCSKSAHAAHGLGGETHLPSKPPHTLTRKGVVFPQDFHRNYHRKRVGMTLLMPGLSDEPFAPVQISSCSILLRPARKGWIIRYRATASASAKQTPMIR